MGDCKCARASRAGEDDLITCDRTGCRWEGCKSRWRLPVKTRTVNRDQISVDARWQSPRSPSVSPGACPLWVLAEAGKPKVPSRSRVNFPVKLVSDSRIETASISKQRLVGRNESQRAEMSGGWDWDAPSAATVKLWDAFQAFSSVDEVESVSLQREWHQLCFCHHCCGATLGFKMVSGLAVAKRCAKNSPLPL